MVAVGALRPRSAEGIRQERDGDGDLPPGWQVEMSTTKNRAYYRNMLTGETRWERPTEPARGPPPQTSPDRGTRATSPGATSSMAAAMNAADAERDRMSDSMHSVPSVGSDCNSYISAASGLRMDCICEICECGRHFCPAHPHVVPYGNVNSTYREKYPPHDVQPRTRPQQQHAPLMAPFDPNHFNTTNGMAYKPHEVQRHPPRSKSTPPPRTKFTGKSTYQAEHYPRTNPDAGRKPVVHKLPPKIPFDHKTTAQTTYVPPDSSDRRQMIRPVQNALPKTPFNGESTYRSHYFGPKALQPTQRVKAPDATILPEDRDFVSMKQLCYQKPEVFICPAAGLPKKKPSKHTGHIHYHKRTMSTVDGKLKTTWTPHP